jgi:hypothetical protein
MQSDVVFAQLVGLVTALIRHAAAYTERGWVVIPIEPGSKKALVKWADLTDPDPDRVRSWWNRWPAASIGVLCGPSKLAVIDVDSTDHLDAIPALPPTATVTTGRGTHHIFTDPGGKVRNTAGRVPVRGVWVDTPGIDLRGVGGLFVAPPSMHRSGTRYTWNPDSLTRGVRTIPGWLRRPAPRPAVPYSGDRDATRQVTGIVQVVLDSPEGERNHRLNWAAYRLGELAAEGATTLEAAEAVLTDAALSVARPDRNPEHRAVGVDRRKEITTMTSHDATTT